MRILAVFAVVSGRMEAVSAPMAGLAGTDSKHSDHEDRQAGPDNVLGRADSVAGQLRGGKTPERPLGSGAALSVAAAAADAVVTERRLLAAWEAKFVT